VFLPRADSWSLGDQIWHEVIGECLEVAVCCLLRENTIESQPGSVLIVVRVSSLNWQCGCFTARRDCVCQCFER
jgi:hypothetical protein